MNEQELPPVICQPVPNVPERWWLNWKIIVAINLTLGAFLWFLYCTNHSLPGIIPDIIYTLVVGAIAFVSLRLKDKGPNPRAKRYYKLSCLPSLVGGGLVVLLVIPPFCLVGMAAFNVIKGFKQVQSLASPDSTRVAIVYEVYESTVTTHSYTMTIRVRHRLLPFVERTVYRSRAWFDQGAREYVRWKDNDTLQLISDPLSRNKSQREVKIAPVRFKFSKSLCGD